MEKYGYIYKITNNINGKIYVGQHKSSTVDEKYWGSGKLIKYAIAKEGLENFSRQILEWCHNKQHLNEREIYWISTLSSENPQIGYNLTIGGEGATPGRKLSEAHRQKISNACKGNKNGNYGNHLSEDSKKRISEANKGEKNVNYGKHPWNYGIKASNETRQKMSERRKGVPHPWSKGKPLTEEHKLKMKESAKNRVYHNVCQNCGQIFTTKGPNKRFCNACNY